VHWIRQSIRLALARHQSNVRRPMNQLHQALRATKRRDDMEQARLESVPYEEAQALQNADDGVGRDHGAEHRVISGDIDVAEAERRETTLWDTGRVGCTEAAQEGDLEVRENVELSDAILGDLPDREREVLTLYYLDGLKLHQIGSRYGLTRERIRQIKNRALERARNTRVARKVAAS